MRNARCAMRDARCAVARWRDSAVVWWCGGCGGAVARWCGGAVAQWRSGAVALLHLPVLLGGGCNAMPAAFLHVMGAEVGIGMCIEVEVNDGAACLPFLRHGQQGRPRLGYLGERHLRLALLGSLEERKLGIKVHGTRAKVWL